MSKSPDDPGAAAARARDEVDPELVSLPRFKGMRPLLGLSLLGFALYLGLSLRHDLAYSLSEDEPRELGDARALFSKDLPDNTHVSVRGLHDVSAPARLRGRQSAGSRVTPILGTDLRLWVREPGEALAAQVREGAVITGRLRRLDELPFAAELGRFLATSPPQPHFVFPEALSAGLPKADVHGTTLAPRPADRVVAVEQTPGVALVTVIQTDQMYEDAIAQRALVAAGVLPAVAAPVAADDVSWTYEVPAPEGPAGVLARLRAAKIFGASVAAKVVRHEGTFAALTVDRDRVVLGPATLPIAALERLIIYQRRPAPPPASIWVILAGDSPGAYWYMKYVFGGLALVAVFVALSTLRRIRDVIKSTRAAKA